MRVYNKPTREDYIEFGLMTAFNKQTIGFYKRSIFFVIAFFILVAIGLLLCFYSLTPLHVVIVALTLFAGLLLLFVRYTFSSLRKRYSKIYDDNPQGHYLTLDERGITTEAENGDSKTFYAWSYVKALQHSEHLFAFIFNNGIGIFINKMALQGRRGFSLPFCTNMYRIYRWKKRVSPKILCLAERGIQGSGRRCVIHI